MPFRYLIKKPKQGEKMNNAQELKAHLQDSNKARMYEEKKKYTQEEAELMADWFNANNQLNTTANISDEIRDLFLQADKIRIKIHQDITDNSNWKFYKKKNNKMGVKYEI